MNIGDVRSKLDIISTNQRQLEWLRQLPKAEFIADARNLDSSLHRLQTTIQALLDIGAYVSAFLRLPSPKHSADIVQNLRAAGLFDAPTAERYVLMVAFRNRVVHLYNRIDPDMVYDILQNHLRDIEQMLQSLVATIVQHPDQPNPPAPGQN